MPDLLKRDETTAHAASIWLEPNTSGNYFTVTVTLGKALVPKMYSCDATIEVYAQTGGNRWSLPGDTAAQESQWRPFYAYHIGVRAETQGGAELDHVEAMLRHARKLEKAMAKLATVAGPAGSFPAFVHRFVHVSRAKTALFQWRKRDEHHRRIPDGWVRNADEWGETMALRELATAPADVLGRMEALEQWITSERWKQDAA